MKRRSFVAAAAFAGTASRSFAGSDSKRALFELRWFHMRTGKQAERTRTFLEKHFAPAAQRAGIGPNGFFGVSVGPQAPSVLAVLSYPSFADMGESLDRLAADKAYAAAAAEFDSTPELNYIRAESSLLKAFATTPRMEVPAPAKSPRLLELRTYEAPSFTGLGRKIGMFDNGEIAIFRRTGLLPVFFGEAIAGANLPNLTYMVAFDDMAQRAKAWGTFANDPEWLKLRATPGLADAEVVSNISNALLSPLPFSAVR